MEVGGVELARFLFDQRVGEIEQIGVGLGVADVAEIGRRLVDLVGIAQRLEHHPAPAGFQADDIFLAAHRQLADADLVRPLERFAEHDERFLGEIVGRHDEIGLVVIDRIDVAEVDELGQLERLAAFQFDLLDLLGLEQDIFALLDLIALEDFVAVDRPDPGTTFS